MSRYYENHFRVAPGEKKPRYEEWAFSGTRPGYRTGRTNGLNRRPKGYGVNRCGKNWDGDPDRDHVRRYTQWTWTRWGPQPASFTGAWGKLDMEEPYMWQGYMGLECNDPRDVREKQQEFATFGWPDVENTYGVRWTGLCHHERRHF